MITKEAIEQLQMSGAKSERFVIDQIEYVITQNNMHLNKISPPLPAPLHVCSLQGVVEFFKHVSNVEDYVVHIPNFAEVAVVSPLDNVHMIRRHFLKAVIPKNEFPFNRYESVETFIIGVMSNFADTHDRQEILQFVSAMQSELIDKSEDDGVKQRVLIKKSITTLGPAVVPNPVVLQPYMTFAEIDQPSKMYVFRVRQEKDRPFACALFDIASRVWEAETIGRIRIYLKSKIEDVIIIS